MSKRNQVLSSAIAALIAAGVSAKSVPAHADDAAPASGDAAKMESKGGGAAPTDAHDGSKEHHKKGKDGCNGHHKKKAKDGCHGKDGCKGKDAKPAPAVEGEKKP